VARSAATTVEMEAAMEQATALVPRSAVTTASLLLVIPHCSCECRRKQ